MSEWCWQGKETWKVSSTDRIVHHYGDGITDVQLASFWRAYKFARYHNASRTRSLYIASKDS